MKNEFLEFLKSGEHPVPSQVTKSLHSKIFDDLKPISPLRAMTKFFLIQFSVGVLTLAVCPQFGIGPYGGGHGISHYFMQIGTWACASFCGFFYFGLSYFFSFLILQKKELQFFSKKRVLFLPTLVASFIILFMLGHRFGDGHSMFFEGEFLTIWLLVGLISTQIALETSKVFKYSKI